MAKVKKRLGEILIDSGLITLEVLEKALGLQKQSGKKLGELLVDEGFITNDQIVEAVKAQLGIQSVNLENINVRQDIINLISETMARKHEVIPIDVINGQLLVVMSDPLNHFAIEDIRIVTGYAVKPAIALRKSILENIEKYYGKSRAEEAAIDYGKAYGVKNNAVEQVVQEDEATAPIIKFINTIIDNAILYSASDIHIEAYEKEMRVRFRIDGVLREIMKTNSGMLEAVVSRLKIMSGLNIAEKRIPQDGRINFISKQKNIDLRVSIAPTMWGEKVVLRLLDKSNFAIDLEKIGLEKVDHEKINRIISNPHGIILVSGPTGSGKTTTLHSVLNILN
ncbi:MAG: ATPase, T2SS/T4P/T4SS family, partial [Candidatus Methanomethyliaceae archaeon]|nr:ATPase, T2SS/T4P/T4SS family [Candidatus Methanomethyliaceae archaeon]